jgi:hypothetical protein
VCKAGPPANQQGANLIQNTDQITLTVGEEATCTITNDDIAPKLHLVKTVTNDNGGTAKPTDFILKATATLANNSLMGTTPVDSGPTLKADTWTLGETNVYGYTAGPWVCKAGPPANQQGSDLVQTGNKITLGVGQEVTCTIVNDDQPGTIVITKVVKGGSSSANFQFTTMGGGYQGFSIHGGQSNSQNLNAGSYTVKELSTLGWVLTGIGGSTNANTPYACTVTGSGGSSGSGDLNTQTATISLKNGDTVTCVFENTGSGATRTQGFWSTHSPLAKAAWYGGTAFGHTFPGVASVSGIGDTLICGRPIDTLGKLMGAFWSNIAKTSTGAKRSSLDQARMQLLQQLVAAELNASAFGTIPSNGTFAAWESALCGTNTSAIKTALSQASAFNTQGDSVAFTPGTSADAKNAKSIADIPFWNVIKP